MSRLSDRLLELSGRVPRKGSTIERLRGTEGVGRSAEWRRAASLPRRTLDLSNVPDLTPLFAVDKGCRGCELCEEGPARLRPIQSAALLEAEAANGLFGAIGVGHGKELICLLLAEAMMSKSAVILTKPRLRDQMLEVDIPRYGQHFRFDMRRVEVVAYSELSIADKADVLDRIDADAQIDLVIANEVHCLRNISSAACARRFRDWRAARPHLRFCGLTGTPGPSVLHYAHLMEWALGDNSPLPRGHRERDDWSRALDAPEEREDRYPIAPGALLDLCGPEALEEERQALGHGDQVQVAFGTPAGRDAEREIARRIYRRRLSETPGVVMSGNAGDADCSLVISARRPIIPPEVALVLKGLRDKWALGDEEFQDAKDVAQKARQLSCGFYYFWDWPGGMKDVEWVEARSGWYKQVSHAIKHRRHLYSPLMVWRAAAAGELGEVASEAWRAWEAVRGRWTPEPPRGVRWLSDFLIEDALVWAEESREPGIIWSGYEEVSAKFRARGLPVYEGGADGDKIRESRERVVVASMVHRDGKNLQHHFSRNLLLTTPANCTDLQQLLGRTHRDGQPADEVTCEIMQHEQSLVSAFESALIEARVVESTQGERQKLLYATKLGF